MVDWRKTNFTHHLPMSHNQIQSPAEVQPLIPQLTVSLDSDYRLSEAAIEANGQAALALALAYGVEEPNAWVSLDHQGDIKKPLLIATLYVESGRKNYVKHVNDEKKVDVSLDASDGWPQEAEILPARERLAMLLVRSGAEPWVKDDAGLDALDWSVIAGSRSMVALLLRHPDCPPAGELDKRVLSLSGRKVPWLHFLANKGRSAMFKDLIGHGLDPAHLDNQGWPPAAWAANTRVLRDILPTYSRENLEKYKELIMDAWAKRGARGFGTAFKYEEMVRVLIEFSPVNKEVLEEAELGKLAERFLAARVSTYYSSELSFNPAATSSRIKDAEERLSRVYELMETRFEWRLEKRTSISRGRWSLMSAAMWAVFFGERGSSTSRDLLGKRVEEILSRMPSHKRDEWLDDEIRPGLTNRGMAGLVLFGERSALSHTGEDIPFLYGRMQGENAPQEMLDSVLRAAVSLVESQASKGAKDEISKCVRKYLQQMEVARHGIHGALPNLPGLVKNGVLQPLTAQHKSLVTDCINAMEREEDPKKRKVAFDAALSLVSLSSTLVFNAKHSGETENRIRVLQNRDRLARSILNSLERHPELALRVDSNTYPFAKEEVLRTNLGNKDPNQNMPSPAQWSVMIQEAQMRTQISDSSPTVAPARPRGRF